MPVTVPSAARDLGPRGSREALGDADPAGPLPAAAAAVLATVPLWWEARAREVGLSGPWLDVSRALEAEVPAVALECSALVGGLVDATGESLGLAYVSALAPAVRARHGRHYTPPSLARQLWGMTREALGVRVPKATRLPGLVRDRACGAGALLLPPLREHVRASGLPDAQITLAGLPNVVEGIDADPYAVWLANVVLAAELLPLLAAVPTTRRRPVPALARVGDGLEQCERLARVEVQNPPYGRVKLSAQERERWAPVLYGHANLYALFLGAGLQGLDAQGVLAALVPTSFTAGLYFRRLRAVLAQQAPLRAAAFVADRDGVFADVLQETCLAIFARKRSRLTTVTRLRDGEAAAVARVHSPRSEGPWLLPRRSDDAPAAAAAARMPLRLADLGYSCSTGPLVWNRRAADLGPIEGADTAPVVYAADVDGGVLHRDEARDRLRYLRLRAGDEAVLVLTEPAVLVQRTTSPEQSRRIVAAELSAEMLAVWGGRVVVENHINVLRPVIDKPLLSLSTLAAVLATAPIDRVVRAVSGSVAISAYELESIPFPARPLVGEWDKLDPEALAGAVAVAYRPKDS